MPSNSEISEHLEQAWHELNDRIELIPENTILHFSPGRKSTLLMYMLLVSGLPFRTCHISVTNRFSSSLLEYYDILRKYCKSMGILVDKIDIVCNANHNTVCSKYSAMKEYRKNVGNFHVSGWNRSSSPNFENVLYPFFGIDDVTLYRLYNRYVPLEIRPVEHIGKQCNCPYGREDGGDRNYTCYECNNRVSMEQARKTFLNFERVLCISCEELVKVE